VALGEQRPNGRCLPDRAHERVVVMWRRKRWAEDQKTIDALSRANARLTADLETMVSESERLKEEVRQRDEVIAALRGESKTKD
jgi:hypothetical protein